MITIYTDGSNVHNGKPYSYGGYGYVITGLYEEQYIGGASMPVDERQPVTNNRAELLAIINALDTVLEDPTVMDEKVEVNSDSKWCVECANGNWKQKKNVDLWVKFNKVMWACRQRGLQVKIQWVKGHAGIELNEKADQIAGAYCKMAKPD